MYIKERVCRKSSDVKRDWFIQRQERIGVKEIKGKGRGKGKENIKIDRSCDFYNDIP